MTAVTKIYVNNGNPAMNRPYMWFISGSDFRTYFKI